MPITKSAKKALRSSARKKVFNLKRKNAMTNVIKKVKKLASQNKYSEAHGLLPQAYKVIDKAAKKGVIKKNAASRKKSRLAIHLAKIKSS
jgi:small subunit ribosomal protein S20